MVASGVIEQAGAVLLVENLRRHGARDWSTPGGVVEIGEDPLVGLTREVAEETGLAVSLWSEPLYRVTTVAADMGWHLDVVVHRALAWAGEVILGNDPDGIVVGAQFCAPETLRERLQGTAQWVHEPMLAWASDGWTGTRTFGYTVTGADRATSTVTRTR